MSKTTVDIKRKYCEPDFFERVGIYLLHFGSPSKAREVIQGSVKICEKGLDTVASMYLPGSESIAEANARHFCGVLNKDVQSCFRDVSDYLKNLKK